MVGSLNRHPRVRGWLSIGFALVVWAWFVPSIYAWLVPPSWYFEPYRLDVQDTIEGVPPRVDFVRAINRDFTAQWFVNVRRREHGDFVTNCGRSGPPRQRYRVDNSLPDIITLDWLTESPVPNPPCDLSPGEYNIVITWQIEAMLDATITAEVVSNVFTVHPRPF